MKRLILSVLAVAFAGCGGGPDDAASSQGAPSSGPQASTGAGGTTQPEGPLGPLGHTGATEPQAPTTPLGPEGTVGAVGAAPAVRGVDPLSEGDRPALMGSSTVADRVGPRSASSRSPTQRTDKHH